MSKVKLLQHPAGHKCPKGSEQHELPHQTLHVHVNAKYLSCNRLAVANGEGSWQLTCQDVHWDDVVRHPLVYTL
jgi:hypothetical protein